MVPFSVRAKTSGRCDLHPLSSSTWISWSLVGQFLGCRYEGCPLLSHRDGVIFDAVCVAQLIFEQQSTTFDLSLVRDSTVAPLGVMD